MHCFGKVARPSSLLKQEDTLYGRHFDLDRLHQIEYKYFFGLLFYNFVG